MHLAVKLRHCSSTPGPPSALFSSLFPDFHFSAHTLLHPPGTFPSSFHFSSFYPFDKFPLQGVQQCRISMKLSPTPTGQNRGPALLGHLPIISAHAFLSEKLQLPRSTSHWPHRSATEQRLNNFISNKNFKKEKMREKRVALQKRDTGNYR